MVAGVLSLTRNGLRDWIVQRVSAVILGLYVIVLLGFFLFHPQVTFIQWINFFHYPVMRIFNVLALLSLIAHAWVGIWTVLTDYIKPLWLRFSLQVLLVLALASYLFWGFEIIWGIY